jgi:hypothetical protein
MSQPAKDEAELIRRMEEKSNWDSEWHYQIAPTDALAAIRAAGWAVVPVEPTEEIQAAIINAAFNIEHIADCAREQNRREIILAENARLREAALRAENARLRETLENSAIMIQGCYDAPTNPDSLPQMLLHYIRAALGVKP